RSRRAREALVVVVRARWRRRDDVLRAPCRRVGAYCGGAAREHDGRDGGGGGYLRSARPPRRCAAGGAMSSGNFFELWVYLAATPLAGLTMTLVAYVLGFALYTRAKLH